MKYLIKLTKNRTRAEYLDARNSSKLTFNLTFVDFLSKYVKFLYKSMI